MKPASRVCWSRCCWLGCSRVCIDQPGDIYIHGRDGDHDGIFDEPDATQCRPCVTIAAS